MAPAKKGKNDVKEKKEKKEEKEVVEETKPRGKGRPKKEKKEEVEEDEEIEETKPRGKGRPKGTVKEKKEEKKKAKAKEQEEKEEEETKPKGKGRPKGKVEKTKPVAEVKKKVVTKRKREEDEDEEDKKEKKVAKKVEEKKVEEKKIPAKRGRKSNVEKAKERAAKREETLKKKATEPPRKKQKIESESEEEEEEDDLWDEWKSIFLVGTEWEIYDTVYQQKWDFDHLLEKLENDYNTNSTFHYVFGSTEGHELADPKHPGKKRVTLVPVLIVVEGKLPPPSEVAITSVMRGAEDVRSLKALKMDWVPYFINPANTDVNGKKKRRSTKISSKIYFLSCLQRKQSIKRMVNAKDKIDTDRELTKLKDYEYAIPYVWIPKNHENEDYETSVNVIESLGGKGLTFEFDWEMDDLKDFVTDLLKANDLEESFREQVVDIIKGKVNQAKAAIREKKLKTKEKLEKMTPEVIEALNTLKCYKFYPQNKDTKIEQTNFINRFYGKATNVYPELAPSSPQFQFKEILPEYQNLKTIADDITN